MWDSIISKLEDIDFGEKMWGYFTSPAFFVSLFFFLVAILLLVLIKRGFALIWKKRKAAKSEASKGDSKEKVPVDPMLKLAEKALKALVVILALLVILQVNGINVTSIVASMGLASAIVGLALQDYLKDLIMGFHILTDRFFAVGDVVRYKGTEGIVISFNTKTTKIQSLDDFSVLSVSNRNIDEIAVLGDFMKINIPLSYKEDVNKIHRVLGEITERIKEIDGVKTAVYKGIFDFKDSSIYYRINYFANPKDKWTIWYKVIKLVQEGLWAEGIEIPFNQLDVHHFDETETNGKTEKS